MNSPRAIHVLPIEPFDERYTADWFEWWPDELREAGCRVNVITGFNEHDATRETFSEREGGEWLDPIKTWLWKGEQVRELASVWRRGEVKDGDVILILDGWGPAATAAATMRDTTGVKVKIVHYWHAGSYDPHDFLSRCGAGRWAGHVEGGWLASADLILVGSESHKLALLNRCGWPKLPPIEIVGVPIHRDWIKANTRDVFEFADRERLVVFPHRLAPEKQPAIFEAIRHAHATLYPDAPETAWVRTRDVTSTKPDYYDVLSKARVVVSCAWQETFGIAMQEGIALGAWPVVPHRLCYPEVVPLAISGHGYVGEYSTVEEAAHHVETYLQRSSSPTWSGYHEHAIPRAADAIKAMA